MEPWLKNNGVLGDDTSRRNPAPLADGARPLNQAREEAIRQKRAAVIIQGVKGPPPAVPDRE
jgi:hypothetical protein